MIPHLINQLIKDPTIQIGIILTITNITHLTINTLKNNQYEPTTYKLTWYPLTITASIITTYILMYTQQNYTQANLTIYTIILLTTSTTHFILDETNEFRYDKLTNLTIITILGIALIAASSLIK